MKKDIVIQGVARLGLPLILISFALVWLAGAASGADLTRDLPGSSRGDIFFSVDVVGFYSGPGLNTEEIYCVVPNAQIRFLAEGEGYKGRLRYAVSFSGPDGKEVQGSSKKIEVGAASAEDATDRTVVQVLQSRIQVAPGDYRVRVTIEDLNARKKTILSYVLRRYKKGAVDMPVTSRSFSQGELAISDIEFARSVTKVSAGSSEKSGYDVVPNATRRYGRLLPEMPVFFEVYDFRPGPGGDSVLATYTVTNRDGNTLFKKDMPMAVRGPIFSNAAVFDVTSLAGGSYALNLTLRDRGGSVLATSTGGFDVVWSLLSWGKYDTEKIEEMTYIFSEDEMARFKSLPAGEQEKFLVEFWKPLDPTPETTDNEAMVEHYRRVAYADTHFGTAGVRGALTDRGRIYIKYGPPDDLQMAFSDYEFLKDKRDMEGGDAVPVDPFERVGMKAGGQAGDDAADQRGGTTVHGKPYETWTYDGPGNPVRRLSRRVASSAGMRFMFVDERGVGDYKLIYSSEKQEY
jgi:GWxTD domain-containing protein